jgi:two-component system cell cycle response regulator DivK
VAGETVLVVEDNALNRKLVRRLLQSHGYRVLIALDGEEAIEIATREKPDLILMDIQLPRMSGYDATRILKSQPGTASIPVLAITAYAMADECKRALAAGCDVYITKPIDTRTFPTQVRQYLDSRGEEGDQEGSTGSPGRTL